MSPPVGEVARSARGVDRQNASPLRVEGSALVAVRRNTPHEVRILRAEHGYSARRRAVKRPKSAKGVWGKTRVFPHSNTLSLLSLSSETVRWTVSEAHYTAKF